MLCRSVRATTLGTLLSGTRFRPNFDRDTIFLGGTTQSLSDFLNAQESYVQHVSQTID
ncbi:MAG: hypothetical protein J07HQX50_01479, partial [Haloquadratum sp. J07HQX50]